MAKAAVSFKLTAAFYLKIDEMRNAIMPNHVTNIIVVSGDDEQRKAMFEAIKNDEFGLGSVDFNKIIPTPENIYQGNLGTAEREKYGSANWYDWNIANWGTKWNSYGYNECIEKNFDGSALRFDTAWSNPQPIIEALATKYSNLGFEHKWADEDFGQNVGHREYAGGEETFSNIPKGGSKEALELASEVLDTPLDEMGYFLNEDSGKYEYHDPDEELFMKM